MFQILRKNKYFCFLLLFILKLNSENSKITNHDRGKIIFNFINNTIYDVELRFKTAWDGDSLSQKILIKTGTSFKLPRMSFARIYWHKNRMSNTKLYVENKFSCRHKNPEFKLNSCAGFFIKDRSNEKCEHIYRNIDCSWRVGSDEKFINQMEGEIFVPDNLIDIYYVDICLCGDDFSKTTTSILCEKKEISKNI